MANSDAAPWWRDAVIYQVYPRSFADADGDGVGDIAGIRARLSHLSDLGVDAIWMSPWYPSPMADAGYDVADYRDIDPVFGTLADAEALITEAHAAGIRMIVDIVPNHFSSEHPWFKAALASPDAPERDYFWFRPGKGPDGAEMPTQWRGEFGGDTWTRVADGRVVPAPVHPGAARPQLGPPGRTGRVRGDPAVLVRPRRGRHPDRLGGAAAQGPARCPRCATTPRTRSTTWTACTRSTGPGGGSPTRTPGTAR